MKNKIDTILFDLDGTLLQFAQDDFIKAYFSKLGKVFAGLGMDAEASVKAVWAGTKAMMMNDGSKTNHARFWLKFAECMNITDDSKLKAIEAACDNFYLNEFDSIKSILNPSEVPGRLISALKAQGYNLVLVTNPLFPLCGVATRLSWVGLEACDFSHITHYENSTYCKPSRGFYREVLEKISKTPEQCLMAGNSPVEDMVAGELGLETFLVTDCLENETGADITVFRRGTLEEFEKLFVVE
jgi:FMN phosphatase YigB (HAD superfamily)